MVTIVNWDVLVDGNLEQRSLLDIFDSIRCAFCLHKPVDINRFNSSIYIRGSVYGKKAFTDGNLITTSRIVSWLVFDGNFSIIKTISGSLYEICISEINPSLRLVFDNMDKIFAKISDEKSFHEYFDMDYEEEFV